MKRINIIILTSPGFVPEPWGNLKKLCEAKGWKYNTLSRKKFPIEWKGHKIYKEPYQ